jgi:ribose 5-phosphate isomerase B
VKVVLAADHGGFDLKNQLAEKLRSEGYDLIDLGTHGPGSVDYPDYAHQAAEVLKSGSAERAILVCGTGVGMAIAANRHAGIRAVNCSDTFTARMSRAHNDSNVLSLGARVVGFGLAADIALAWLTGEFEGERHVARVKKIERSEST